MIAELPTFSEIEWNIWKWITSQKNLIPAIVMAAIGIPAVIFASRILSRVLRIKLGVHGGNLLARVIRYVGFILVVLSVLHQLDIKIGAVLGAAGVVGVAVGFASQTSLSNLISGLFIVAEKSFQVGDVVEVDNITGTVEDIGLLSMNLRTFDNRSIRVPNETLVKTKVTNVTRYPIRRFDLTIGVSYSEDIAKVLRVLSEVTDANIHCLDEPDPLILFTGFGESSLNFQVGAWVTKEDYLKLRNELPRQIKEAFDREGISIPFPHRVFVAGKNMPPIPVQIQQP